MSRIQYLKVALAAKAFVATKFIGAALSAFEAAVIVSSVLRKPPID